MRSITFQVTFLLAVTSLAVACGGGPGRTNLSNLPGGPINTGGGPNLGRTNVSAPGGPVNTVGLPGGPINTAGLPGAAPGSPPPPEVAPEADDVPL